VATIVIEEKITRPALGSEDSEGDTSMSEEDVLRVARTRLTLAEEAESDIRRQALDDLKFRAGIQWPETIQQERERDGRPCLVINRLPQFVQQITNDQRQNRPAIKVHPVTDGADSDTAKIIQGLIRHIEYNSNAEAAYDTAFESAVTNGFGYFRIVTDFARPESFDLEAFIKRIRNPLSVFIDPYSQEPDGSDMKWAFITDDISKDDYKESFPDSKLAAPEADWSAIGNDQPGWVKGDSARIAEYFSIEKQTQILHLLNTGEVVRDGELAQKQMQAQAAHLDASVVSSKVAHIPIVKWRKINGIEILEETEWPGSYIPIIPVYGAEIFVNGRRILESVIRNAKDAQRMYNYWKSAETETIALAPRTPFIVAEGQLEGYEKDWAGANRKNHAFLYYKPTTIAGEQAPPPQRQTFEPATQAITQASMLAADDLKATTGVFDAALGQQTPDASGVAIQSRQGQSQNSNFHFVDNLHRSIKHAGRILVDIIPKIYDTARTARIIHDDGTQKMVRVNEQFQDETGKDRIYSLDAGRYGVTIDTGPSFASKRQEASAAMTEAVRAYPQLMQIIGDLMIKNMDWPGAQEMAERLRLTLPPQLQNDPKAMKIPPQVQAQIQQMQMMVKQLSQELNETTKIIETKKLDLESKERIEFAKLQAEIEISLAKLGTQSSIALLQEEVGAINQRLKLVNMNQPIDVPPDFNPQGADGGNYAGMGHVGSGPTGGPAPGTPMEPPVP
jgi:hypothetical protein